MYQHNKIIKIKAIHVAYIYHIDQDVLVWDSNTVVASVCWAIKRSPAMFGKPMLYDLPFFLFYKFPWHTMHEIAPKFVSQTIILIVLCFPDGFRYNNIIISWFKNNS